MDELEFALETVGGEQFEQFSAAFLRAEGYDVHESGRHGADGGWDARISIGDRAGIAHASTATRWKRKLRQDAEKVESLADERGTSYDVFVFVTSQSVNGQAELDMIDEIQTEYGWRLKLYHRDVILGELRQNHQHLADEFFDIDLGPDQAFYTRTDPILTEQITDIHDRTGYADDLGDGPAIALHVIPHGAFSQGTVPATELPAPPVLLTTHAGETVTRGKHTYRFRTDRDGDVESYGVFRNDGVYESVDVSSFYAGRDETPWIQGSVSKGSFGVDAGVILTTRKVSTALTELGFSGTASLWLSLVDAADVKLVEIAENTPRLSRSLPPAFDRDRYRTEPTTFGIGRTELIGAVKPALDELWRQFGRENGTPNIDEETWTGGRISINREPLLEEGDM